MSAGQNYLPVPAAVLAAILAWQGIALVREGVRLEPLDMFVHTRWWGTAQPSLPPGGPVSWRPANADGRRWAAYSQALVQEAGAEAGGLASLADAVAATERSLSLAPAQPAAWARLALLRLNLGAHGQALAALNMSWRTGPAMRGLAWVRSQIALYLWAALPSKVRDFAAADIRRLWRQPASVALPYPRQALVRFAHGAGRLNAVREALPKGEHALLNKRIQSVLMEAASAS